MSSHLQGMTTRRDRSVSLPGGVPDKIQCLKNIGKKDQSERKEIYGTGALSIGVCGHGSALPQANRVTLDTSPWSGCSLSPLCLGYTHEVEEQLKDCQKNHQMLLQAIDTNNDCNFTYTQPYYKPNVLSIS